jgi:hypothetical protein
MEIDTSGQYWNIRRLVNNGKAFWLLYVNLTSSEATSVPLGRSCLSLSNNPKDHSKKKKKKERKKDKFSEKMRL